MSTETRIESIKALRTQALADIAGVPYPFTAEGKSWLSRVRDAALELAAEYESWQDLDDARAVQERANSFVPPATEEWWHVVEAVTGRAVPAVDREDIGGNPNEYRIPLYESAERLLIDLINEAWGIDVEDGYDRLGPGPRLFDAESLDDLGAATGEQLTASHAAPDGIITVDADGRVVQSGPWDYENAPVRRVFVA